MNENKIFSKRLIEVRSNRLLKQSDVATLIGTKFQSISNWEAGRNYPTVPMLINLADALNVSLDYLVGRTDDPNKTVEPVQAYEEIPKWLKPMLNDLSNLDKNGQKAVKALVDGFKK